MTETYIVTGGAGFIGSHIAERLLNEGHQVRVIDNLLTGKRENIAHLQGRPGFTFHEASITGLNALHPLFAGVDYVFHQAALPSVPRSVADPLETHQHCVTGTLNVLQAARAAGVKRVVYASSSSVYGDIEGEYKVETLPPQPKSPYGAAKLAAEYYCRVFTDTYGLETVSLRYFNVFGPRQDPSSEYAAVIPKFITLMLDGTPPTIYGDGEQSRDFTFIDNVVHGNLLAAKAPDVAGEVFNMATGGRITLLQLVDKLNRAMDTGHTPHHASERPGDIKHSRAGIDKAHAMLNYAPVTSFDDGLMQTVNWFTQATGAS